MNLNAALHPYGPDIKKPEDLEIWFVTGSQHLYGPEALSRVAENSQKVSAFLDADDSIPFKVVFKPVLTTSDEVRALCREANSQKQCIGFVLWMPTFSPEDVDLGFEFARQTDPALSHAVQPRSSVVLIDMDFMNLNQAAHGDREFGFITARLKLARR